MQKSLVIVDVETTGLSPWYHRVIEIGAIKIKQGKIEAKFQALMRSVEVIPWFITRLTGITSDMLFENGEEPEDLLPKFRDFLGDACFVAHNVSFDYNFLNAEFSRYRLPVMQNDKLCTAVLSRKHFPHLPNHKLTTMKEHLNVKNERSHRALADALVCWEILKKTKQFDTTSL